MPPLRLEVTADEIKAFAARFDPQPFHLDEEAAKRSLFGALAASGWHTAAMTMRLLVDSTLRPSDGMIGLGGEITWPRPTYAGDVLRVESEVIETTRSRSNPRRGVVTMRRETTNQRGEPVQIATDQDPRAGPRLEQRATRAGDLGRQRLLTHGQCCATG